MSWTRFTQECKMCGKVCGHSYMDMNGVRYTSCDSCDHNSTIRAPLTVQDAWEVLEVRELAAAALEVVLLLEGTNAKGRALADKLKPFLLMDKTGSGVRT